MDEPTVEHSDKLSRDSGHFEPIKSGVISLFGRSNVGKSTLLNSIIGQKLSIVSDKPQTTRTRILGVKNYKAGQVVFVDTPGVHKPSHRLNVRMVKVAFSAIKNIDLLALVVDASRNKELEDQTVLRKLEAVDVPVFLILNKVDLIKKPSLLPIIDRYRKAYDFSEYVPVSAIDGFNLDLLEQLFLKHLPEGDPLYPEDYLTDQPERMFVAEFVREQVIRRTHAELPFSTAVIVDKFEESKVDSPMRLYCSILVEKKSQKPIVLGKGGSMIRKIGQGAREEIERFFETRVYLDLHVKVQSEWRENEQLLDELGLSQHKS